MPHYRLNVYNSLGLSEDREGEFFPDLNAAHRAAVKGIRSILSDEVKAGTVNLRGCVEIVDDADRTILTVPYREAVALVE